MTINLFVRGQHLSLGTCAPFVVSDTIHYIDAQVTFLTPDWTGLVKWAHFAQGDKVYDVLLDDDDSITQDAGLDLGAGVWEVYLHGNRIEDGLVTQRITTNGIEITVRRSGTLNGEPLPKVPPSAAEQILATAEKAKRIAKSVQDGEQQRREAEIARADAERQRRDAETARATAEQGREMAEQGRSDAERQRRSDWQTLKSDAEKSTADAKAVASGAAAAATDANAAAKSANDAAAAAREAAQGIDAKIDARLGGLSFAVNADDGGLDLTYTYDE